MDVPFTFDTIDLTNATTAVTAPDDWRDDVQRVDGVRSKRLTRSLLDPALAGLQHSQKSHVDIGRGVPC